DPSNYQPTIHFMATNADPSMNKDFYNLVINELKKIVEEGLDTELVTSSLRSMEFEEALGSNASSGVNAIINASLYDNLLGNPLVDINSYYKKVAANLDQRVLEEILEQHVINNTFAALTVTNPKVGLLEKNQTAISQELAEKKSSMSKEEINELVKDTADFNIWNSQQTSAEVLKTLRAVELKDISAEVKVYDINETVIDGVALMSTTAAVDTISTMYLNFDMSQLTKEELLYLKFYSDMLNNGMATKNRTESQVMNETALKAYGISTSVNAMMDDKKDTSAHPVFAVNYYGFEDEYTDTFDLVSDVILQSKVSDISTYGTRTIANLKANFEYQFAEPLNLALYRSLAYTSASYRYANYLNGLDYYQFIMSLEKQITSEPSKVVEKIEAIREKAFNKSNLTVLFAGDTSALKKFKSSMTDFTTKLPDETYPKADYTLPRPERREALVINSSVQYLVVNSSLSKSHVPSSGKGVVITTMLNNLMLTPEIRLKGGAYGVAAMIEGNNYATYTYRDSNFMNSLATIGATDEFLQAVIPYMTEEALESYKLSAYASASMSSGEINDALIALINKSQGVTTQDRINTLKEIKSTTLSDIEEYSKYLYNINMLMNYVIVASPSEIEANKDMFDSIISLQ
ncbi:MAG TPA: hypothetical protein VJ888_09505, partial [Mobilitalea sp.]|nr:hypothetical protein [Mobilitalea sp.]